MNDNYLEYNHLGILKNSQLQEVSQGNHNVDYYYITYDEYDYTDGYVTVSCTLPDGTSFPELSTSPKDFEFDGQNYKGFMFVLRDTLTTQAGVLSMTFNLKSIENNTQLCSSRLNITIHESDIATEPTITQSQFDYMQETIRENHNDLTGKVNDAVKKAEEALYHDATIVKINGEVQTTWDATFSQKLYEESANLFDGIYDLIGKYINPSTGQYATASGYKASSKLYPIDTNKIYFKISEPSRTMNLLFYDASGNYINEYLSLNTLTSYVYTIQGNAKYFRTYTAEENNANIMISATDLPYQEYHGEIIHSGDIEPVLLWKNETPNVDFTQQIINLSENANNYKYLIILYKPLSTASYIPNEMKMKLSMGSVGVIHAQSIGYYGYRRFDNKGDTIDFYDAYLNNTTSSASNNFAIPVEIYGSNY